MNAFADNSRLTAENGETVDITITRPKTIGLVAVFLTFGVFGTWASFAPIQGAAHAPALVTIKDSRKTIQHLEGGIIDKLYVHEGDWVEAGDPLIKLDDTQAKAQLEMNLGQLYAAKAEEARLLSERDARDVMTIPALLGDAADPRAAESTRVQRNLFAARRASRMGQTSVLEQRIDQLGAKARGMRSLKQGKLELIDSYSVEIKDYRELLEEGFSDRTRLREMERSVTSLQSEVADNDATLAGIQIEIGETELEIIQLERDFQTGVADGLSEVQSEVFDLEEKIRALSDKLMRTEIISPVTGKILDMSVHTIGGVIRPGEAVLDVVPDEQELLLNAKIRPKDIDRLHIGQKAEIRFSSFNTRDTPVIEGILLGLSADILEDEFSKDVYYEAKVGVTEKGLAMLGDLQLLPGMPAEILVHTGSRTLFQYLWAPLGNSLARAMIER